MRHLTRFCTKPIELCSYFHSVDHVTGECLEMVAKWEEKRDGNHHMVTVESHQEDTLKYLVHVCVIVLGGACTSINVVKGRIEPHKENILKMMQP